MRQLKSKLKKELQQAKDARSAASEPRKLFHTLYTDLKILGTQQYGYLLVFIAESP